MRTSEIAAREQVVAEANASSETARERARRKAARLAREEAMAWRGRLSEMIESDMREYGVKIFEERKRS